MLNDRQGKVSESLRNIAPWVADMFDDAVRILNDAEFSGESKVRFVAHAGREICTRLPAIVSGETSSRFSYQKEVQAIAKMLEEEGLQDLKYTEEVGEAERK